MHSLTVMMISALICLAMGEQCPDGKECNGECCKKFIIGNGYWCCRGVLRCKRFWGLGYCLFFSEPYLNRTTNSSPDTNLSKDSRSEIYPNEDFSDIRSYSQEDNTFAENKSKDKDENIGKPLQVQEKVLFPDAVIDALTKERVTRSHKRKSGNKTYRNEDFSDSSYSNEDDTNDENKSNDNNEDIGKPLQPQEKVLFADAVIDALTKEKETRSHKSLSKKSGNKKYRNEDFSYSSSYSVEDDTNDENKSKDQDEDIGKPLQVQEKVLFAEAVVDALMKEKEANPEEFKVWSKF